MQENTYKKSLIVLLNFAGSYKGGAQRRYLALFNHLQVTGRDDYMLLLNDTLYESCFRDNILKSSRNVLSIKVNYSRKVSVIYSANKIGINETKPIKKRNSRIYIFLGLLSGFLKQAWGWIGYSINLLNVIKKYNITLIYGIFLGGIWSWQIAKFLKIKFIYSYNDASAMIVDKRILKILNSEYYVLKFADKIDFLSEGVRIKLLEREININEERTLISPNSFILYENFYPEYPKKNTIIFCSRLTKVKNPHLLLEAIHILSSRGFNNFDVYFLGEGILLQELTSLKEKMNLSNVLFEGGVIDTAKYLRLSSIFISIQLDNNYPSQALLEAMACENAIIASDVGETRKLVTENEGILVPLISEKIADAIQYLLENPAECERLGKNARKKATEEHNIEKYSKYFFEIME